MVVYIHLDYFYMTKENEKSGQNPMLVVVDSRKKNVMGIATGSTGEVPWVAKKIADEVEAWGYGSTSIVLLSDNEPAILSLKRAVMARRDKETILMETIEGDSQANGVAERAVRTLDGANSDDEGGARGQAGKEYREGAPVVAMDGAVGRRKLEQVCSGERRKDRMGDIDESEMLSRGGRVR